MFGFSKFFLEKWIFRVRKMLKFLKNVSFSNTYLSYKFKLCSDPGTFQDLLLGVRDSL